MQLPGSAAVGPLVKCAGYVICGKLERPAVAIVSMNPRGLWTPPLWGRGSIVSRTVHTFTPNLQWWQCLLHLGGCVQESTIYRNEFHMASKTSATYGKASPIRTVGMEKRLQIGHQHIHNNTSIHIRTTSYEPVCAEWDMTINTSTSFVKRKRRSPQRSVSNFDLPPYSRLCQFRLDAITGTPLHTYVHIHHWTTVFEHMCLKGKRRYSA
jgi:hypothetical protein